MPRSLLGEAEHIPETEVRLINIIENQARRMNGIVENILQLSRREKSRPEMFELTAWLSVLKDEFSGAMPTLDLALYVEADENEVMVMFDRSQLHQHCGN